MKSLLPILFLSFVIMAIPSLATAQKAPMTGFYGALGGAYATQNFDLDPFTTTDLLPVGTTISANNAIGGNLKFGYSINSQFDVEFDALVLAGFNVEGTEPDQTVKELERIKGNVLSMNAKGYFTDRASNKNKFHPYGIVGAGYGLFNEKIKTEEPVRTETSIGLMLHAGVGAEYNLTSTLSLYSEVSYYLGLGNLDDRSFIPIKAGVMLNF